MGSQGVDGKTQADKKMEEEEARITLEKMSLPELRKMALSLGVTEDELEDADDAIDTKEALIELIEVAKEVNEQEGVDTQEKAPLPEAAPPLTPAPAPVPA